jgi:hypothetical protein
MAEQPETARFRVLFDTALQDYRKQTGIELSNDSEHSLVVRLQSLHNEDDIANLLKDRANALQNFQENDRILKTIKVTVSILTPLSKAASLADAVGVVRQKPPVVCSTPLTPFSDIIPTCEGSRGWSRYLTRSMCSSMA